MYYFFMKIMYLILLLILFLCVLTFGRYLLLLFLNYAFVNTNNLLHFNRYIGWIKSICAIPKYSTIISEMLMSLKNYEY